MVLVGVQKRKLCDRLQLADAGCRRELTFPRAGRECDQRFWSCGFGTVPAVLFLGLRSRSNVSEGPSQGPVVVAVVCVALNGIPSPLKGDCHVVCWQKFPVMRRHWLVPYTCP